MSEVTDIAHTYQWLNKSNIKAITDALIMAAQDQVLNTRAVAHKIYHSVQDPGCRLCKQRAGTVVKQQLPQVHREKFTNVSLTVYRAICAEYNLEHSKDWSVEPEKIVNNDRVKILRDFSTLIEKHCADQLQGTDWPHN